MLTLIAILALIVIAQSVVSSTKWTLALLIFAVLLYCFPLLILLMVAIAVAGAAYLLYIH